MKRGDGTNLTQQCRLTNRRECAGVAAERRFDDGIAHVGGPTLGLGHELIGARVAAERDDRLSCSIWFNTKRRSDRRRGPVRESDAIESETLASRFELIEFCGS